jgi:hypothetical protein
VTVRLRPHHLLCMLTYVGKGYSPSFVARFDEIAARLGAGEEILVVAGPDDVCAPLLADEHAHCHRPGVTERDERAAEAVAALLGSTAGPGARFMLEGPMLDRMRAAFHAGTSRAACQDCQWAGLCGEVAEGGFRGVRLRMDEMAAAGR